MTLLINQELLMRLNGLVAKVCSLRSLGPESQVLFDEHNQATGDDFSLVVINTRLAVSGRGMLVFLEGIGQGDDLTQRRWKEQDKRRKQNGK